MHITSPDQLYTHEYEFAQDSQWGDVVLWLAAQTGNTNVMHDGDDRICLGPRMYTDDQLGKLDGPGRYIRKPDPVYLKAITGLGGLTKRQRRAARKVRRLAKRQGTELTTIQLIAIVTA